MTQYQRGGKRVDSCRLTGHHLLEHLPRELVLVGDHQDDVALGQGVTLLLKSELHF